MVSIRVVPPSSAAISWTVPKRGRSIGDLLGEVVELPLDQIVQFEGEDDDRAAGDAAQLGQAAGAVLPVVDGDAGHRGVDRVAVERQRFGRAGERRGGTGGALGAHRRARLDRQDPAVAGLVGAGAGTDVQDHPRVAQCCLDRRREPWVGPPPQRVVPPMRLVVDPARHRKTVLAGRSEGTPERTSPLFVREGVHSDLPRRTSRPGRG
jgi:hypothetical protein